MPKDQKQAQTRIELALFQSRNPISPDILGALPVIDDWYPVADHDVPHIWGIAAFPVQTPRPILTAAVIGIETMPTLVIRCLDGCYQLGHPARVDNKIQLAGDDRKKGRISWFRFQRLIEALVVSLSGPDDGVC